MDNFEKLQQLKKLLDEGILTQEEYEKSKTQILFPEKKVVEEKKEEAVKPKNQIVNSISSSINEKKIDKKALIIGAVCVVGILVILFASSAARAKRAEEEKATIAAYTESLQGTYRYDEGGGYFVSLSFWNDGDLYVVTNDFVAGSRNAFLSLDSYFNYYTGHTYWAVGKDSKGYYVSTGLYMYDKFYLPENSTTTPQQLVDSDGHVFQ